MKRYIAILIGLAFILSGCSTGSESGTADKIKSGQTHATEAAVQTTAPTEPEKEFLYGMIDGNSYIDKYAGFACDFDDNWLLSLAERGADLAENSVCFADFQAESDDGYSFIDVQYVDVSEEDLYSGRALSDSEVADMILESDNVIKDILEGSGVTVNTSEKVSVTFLGKDTVAVLSTCGTEEMPVYFLQYCNYTFGNYNLVITIMTIFEDTTADLLAGFYPITQQESGTDKAEPKLAHGYLEGTTYIDEASGFAFDFDDNWMLEADDYSVEDLTKVEEGHGYFGFNADLVDGPFAVHINYVCEPEEELDYYRSHSGSEAADNLMLFKDVWTDVYEVVGYKVESIKKVKTEFLGKETYGMLITCTANDQYTYALKIKDYSLGDYSVEITVTSHFENYTDELLGMFYNV